MGNEIHKNMSIDQPLTIGVDRGLSLHKMIRLMTHSLAGESYMNSIGIKLIIKQGKKKLKKES